MILSHKQQFYLKEIQQFVLKMHKKTLNEHDLINDFLISKFNSDYIYYQVIFNGTPNNFLKVMKEKNYNFDTQNKIWFLK